MRHYFQVERVSRRRNLGLIETEGDRGREGDTRKTPDASQTWKKQESRTYRMKERLKKNPEAKCR